MPQLVSAFRAKAVDERDQGYPKGRFNHSITAQLHDVFETMLTGNGRTYFVNRANAGAVTNLPDDAFLELECSYGTDGPEPLPVGAFPLGLRSLQMQILDAHELTIEAIMKQDRTLLVWALAIDPLVQSIATAEAVIDALYTRQSEVLPAWVAGKPSERAEVASAPVKEDGYSPRLY